MSAESDSESSSSTSVWQHRPFVWYWGGGAITSTGTWIQNVTASVLIYQLTGSSLMVGLLNFANFSPVFALSIVGGVLGDRFDRKVIVVVTHLFSSVVAVGLAVLTLTDRITPLLLILAAALIGSSHALSKPTLSSLLPSLVPRDMIARASAINVLQFTMGQIVGSTLATILLTTVGAGMAFAVNSATFLGPVVAVLVISSSLARVDKSSRKGFQAALEGVQYVRQESRMVAILLCVVLTNAASEGLRTLAPATVVLRLGASEEATGLLVGAFSTGAAIGLLSFGQLSKRFSPSRLLGAGFVLEIVGAVGLALSFNMPMGLAFAVPIGIGFALLTPLLNAGLQELSSDAFRGRVMSAFSMAHLGIRPLWSLLAGGVAVGLGPAGGFIAVTAAGLVGLRLTRKVGASSEPGGTVY